MFLNTRSCVKDPYLAILSLFLLTVHLFSFRLKIRNIRNIYQIEPNWTTVRPSHASLATLCLAATSCFCYFVYDFGAFEYCWKFCGHKYVCVFVDSVVEFSADNPITEITLFYNLTECFQARFNDCWNMLLQLPSVR